MAIPYACLVVSSLQLHTASLTRRTVSTTSRTGCTAYRLLRPALSHTPLNPTMRFCGTVHMFSSGMMVFVNQYKGPFKVLDRNSKYVAIDVKGHKTLLQWIASNRHTLTPFPPLHHSVSLMLLHTRLPLCHRRTPWQSPHLQELPTLAVVFTGPLISLTSFTSHSKNSAIEVQKALCFTLFFSPLFLKCK